MRECREWAPLACQRTSNRGDGTSEVDVPVKQLIDMLTPRLDSGDALSPFELTALALALARAAPATNLDEAVSFVRLAAEKRAEPSREDFLDLAQVRIREVLEERDRSKRVDALLHPVHGYVRSPRPRRARFSGTFRAASGSTRGR